jgi:uncharacterized membrane protein (TIGR02234 family)
VSRGGGALLAVGLLVASLSAGRVWVRFTLRDPVLGPQSQDATGYAVAPALSACGLMALAALLVVLLTRRRARLGGLLVLALSAVWAGWIVGEVLGDPSAAARAGLEQPGAAGPSVPVAGVETTPWPWVCALGVLVVVLGLLWLGWSWSRRRTGPGLARGISPSPGRPRPGASPLSDAERARRNNSDAWSQLSEGKDPTD